MRKQPTPPTKQHGGHNAGQTSHLSRGHGPLYDYRQRHSLTQAALAELLGCGKRTVERYENAGERPRGAAGKLFEQLEKSERTAAKRRP